MMLMRHDAPIRCRWVPGRQPRCAEFEILEVATAVITEEAASWLESCAGGFSGATSQLLVAGRCW